LEKDDMDRRDKKEKPVVKERNTSLKKKGKII
jgi:hypothetical protein